MMLSNILNLISCIYLDDKDTPNFITRSTPSPTFVAYYMSKKYGDTLLTRNNYSAICIMNSKNFISYTSSDKFLFSRCELEYLKPLSVFPFEYINHRFVLINEIYIPESAIKIIVEKICMISEKLIKNYEVLSKILYMTRLVEYKVEEGDICRNICVKNAFILCLRNILKSIIQISPYVTSFKKSSKKHLSEYRLFFNSLYESLIYDYENHRKTVNNI
ncbi:hypothetical protein P3W45_000729 [Vairimorpha bombi]